jgi:alpha-beta hydrolase superfamily lysophospholipase
MYQLLFLIHEFTVPIRDQVATQIAEALHKADLENGANTPVHFVAHSLGSAVLHDSIATLAEDPAFSPGTHEITSIVASSLARAIAARSSSTSSAAIARQQVMWQPRTGWRSLYSTRSEVSPSRSVNICRTVVEAPRRATAMGAGDAPVVQAG